MLLMSTDINPKCSWIFWAHYLTFDWSQICRLEAYLAMCESMMTHIVSVNIFEMSFDVHEKCYKTHKTGFWTSFDGHERLPKKILWVNTRPLTLLCSAKIVCQHFFFFQIVKSHSLHPISQKTSHRVHRPIWTASMRCRLAD